VAKDLSLDDVVQVLEGRRKW